MVIHILEEKRSKLLLIPGDFRRKMDSSTPTAAAQGFLSCGYCRTGIWLLVANGKPYWWDSYDAGDAQGTKKIVSIMTKAGIESAFFYCATPKCTSKIKMAVGENGFLEIEEDR